MRLHSKHKSNLFPFCCHPAFALLTLIALMSSLVSSPAQARQCLKYLASEPLSPATQTALKFDETWDQYNQNPNSSRLRSHINATKAHLDAMGVHYSYTQQKILIIPNEATTLNQFANRLFKRYQTLAFYDPKTIALRGCEACVEYSAFSLTLNFLILSKDAIKTAQLTPAEIHEWRHVVEISKYTKDTLTPLLSGNISVLKKQGRKLKNIDFTIEEFFTYYTESRAAMSLYRSGQMSEKEALQRLLDNFEFLKDYAVDILDYIEAPRRVIKARFGKSDLHEIYRNLAPDVHNLAIMDGNIGFFFTPISNGKHRVQLHVFGNDFGLVMMLKEPVRFTKVNTKTTLPELTFEEFQWLVNKSTAQFLDVHLGIIKIFETLDHRFKTIEDYQNLLNTYREILIPYQ